MSKPLMTFRLKAGAHECQDHTSETPKNRVYLAGEKFKSVEDMAKRDTAKFERVLIRGESSETIYQEEIVVPKPLVQDVPETDGLDDMSVAKLRDFAVVHRIDLTGMRSKEEIVKAIRTKMSTPEPE